MPKATASPCRIGFPIFRNKLSTACPIVCPKFKVFLIFSSLKSAKTISNLIFALGAMRGEIFSMESSGVEIK